MNETNNMTDESVDEATKIIMDKLQKYRNGEVKLTEPPEIVISPEYQAILDTGKPEVEVAEMFLYSYLTFDQYQEFKNKNSAYVELHDQVHEFLAPRFLPHPEKEGISQLEFYLELKSSNCYGFQIYCENGELELVQVLQYLNFMNTSSEEDWEKYKRKEYWDLYRSVGKTRDVNLVADYIRHIEKHNFNSFTGVFPLSLKAYMVIKEVDPMDYEIVRIDDENRKLTSEEEIAKQAALDKIAVYIQ